MFERYTEAAHLAFFEAAFQAFECGSSSIETEHLLGGLLRTDPTIAQRYPGLRGVTPAAGKDSEKEPEAVLQPAPHRDLPLSIESTRALAYAAEESERVGVRHIGTEHLLLGLLREETSHAARTLRERGLELAGLREEIVRMQISQAGAATRTESRGVTFEPYPDSAAGRTILFARYEASQLGSMSIETEHLLLGLLRAESALALRLLGDDAAIEAMRREIERRRPAGKNVATTVDLPLSEESKHAMAFAAEEAMRASQQVGNQHLLAGLLRVEKCLAAELLRHRGVTLERVRKDFTGG
jgi:ATP-dependent Clp protease ATP-binding subunit ClpA